MKKKLIALMMGAVMAFSLTACGSSNSTANTGASEAAGSEAASTETADNASANLDMKVAMVTDYGDITDQSFNQTTYESGKAWAEENGVDFTYYKPEGDSTADRVAMIDKAVADGYNVLLLPGYSFAEAVVETAEMYPDVDYVVLDCSEADFSGANGGAEFSADNVFSAAYSEEIGGYLAGYAAVKMGYKNLGFLGGMAVPAVMRFGYGFVEGADDAAAEDGITDISVNYAYGNQFSGDADITAAMDTWYQGGTEVVFACGGGIYTSAAEAAAKTDGKVIGVDSDQKPIIDGAYGDGMTVTSATKGLKATVNLLLNAIKNGEFANYGGQVQTLGLASADDMSLNYIGLSDSTVWTDNFTEDTYKALVASIFNGEVTVSNDTSAEEPSAENVKINFQGNLK
ncbi:MAG: BMP family ABC transporter substrate-binding protein [Lachnospiraceae bacterium]|nr:BMP family ABC transporter substrate-binding protein [Lachnospiraceae bacterium]